MIATKNVTDLEASSKHSVKVLGRRTQNDPVDVENTKGAYNLQVCVLGMTPITIRH